MTIVSRVTSFAQHQQLMQNVGDTQSKLAVLQNQISSGRVAENYSELNGQIEFLGSLENKMRAADAYINNNELVKSRLKTSSGSVTNLLNITTDLQKLISISKSTYMSEGATLMQQAKSFLSDISNQLNANIGGRYLFAGSKTDTAPVAESIPPSITSGVADDLYYSGDDVVLSTKINDKFTISYGVNANDPAFQQLIAAANMTITALQTQSADQLGSALDMAQSALEGINAIQSTINNNIVNIDNANDQHSALKLYWKGLAEQQTNTDLVSASSQVAVDQALLQASFQVFAKISSLRLSDFLR